MAHVEKRASGRWRGRYRGPDGRERSRTFNRKADAERWLTTQGADLARGDWLDPQLGRITFAHWVEHWEQTLLDLRPTTRALNLGVVRNYLLPRFGPWPVFRITTADVEAMVAQERADGVLSNSAIRRHVFVLSGILQAAARSGRIARNPCTGVRLPPDSARQMRFLTPEEVAGLASAIGEHYRPLVLTAAYAGLRWGELAGLRLENVDLLRRRIRVDEQLLELTGGLTFGPPKTKAGIRTVAIPPTLGDVLARHFAAAPVRGSGLAFPTPSGSPMRRSNFRRVWQRACRAVNLEGLVFHELRHTAAALAIAEGAHPVAIKERLGHSSITVTMDRYGKLFPSLDEAIAEGLDVVLRGASATA
jgi:integrase